MNIKITKIVMMILAFTLLDSCCSYNHLDFQLYDPNADYSNQNMIRFDGVYIFENDPSLYAGRSFYSCYQFYPNGLILKSYTESNKYNLLNGEYSGKYGFYKITDDIVNIEVFGDCLEIFRQYEFEINGDTLTLISNTEYHRGFLGIGRVGKKHYLNILTSRKRIFNKADKIIPIPPYDKLKIKLSQPFYRDSTLKGN